VSPATLDQTNQSKSSLEHSGMMRFVRVAVFFLILLSAGRPESLFCNDAVFSGDGVTVFPVKAAAIQMVTDSVVIKRGGGLGWRVEVVATFKNFGPDAVVQVGFPFDYGTPETSDTEFEGEYPRTPDFRAFVNGKSVSVTPKRGVLGPDSNLAYDLVYLFDVSFQRGESKTIRQTYTVGGLQNSMGGETFNYVLKTGSLWKDSIEKLSITLELDKKDVPYWHSVSPPEHKAVERDGMLQLYWSYENIKPSFDLTVEHLPCVLDVLSLDELQKSPDFFLCELLKHPDVSVDDLLKHSDLSLDELLKRVEVQLQPAEARYYRNLTYARYGYPFKNPFVRAQFYGTGNLKENPTFNASMIKPNDKKFIDYLNELEKKHH